MLIPEIDDFRATINNLLSSDWSENVGSETLSLQEDQSVYFLMKQITAERLNQLSERRCKLLLTIHGRHTDPTENLVQGLREVRFPNVATYNVVHEGPWVNGTFHHQHLSSAR
jgi:hypothetical protein